MEELPPWLLNFPCKWIQLGEVFKFLGIPFAFQASPTLLWANVVQKIEKKLDYWFTKKLSLASKFQICSKVLSATHIYYSSCWVPSKNCYKKFERLLKDFLWSNSHEKRGFHQVAWEHCCLPRASGGMGMPDCNRQGIALCAKWVVRAISRNEAWKVLICHFLSIGTLFNRQGWKGLDLASILIAPMPI